MFLCADDHRIVLAWHKNSQSVSDSNMRSQALQGGAYASATMCFLWNNKHLFLMVPALESQKRRTPPPPPPPHPLMSLGFLFASAFPMCFGLGKLNKVNVFHSPDCLPLFYTKKYIYCWKSGSRFQDLF